MKALPEVTGPHRGLLGREGGPTAQPCLQERTALQARPSPEGLTALRPRAPRELLGFPSANPKTCDGASS